MICVFEILFVDLNLNGNVDNPGQKGVNLGQNIRYGIGTI